MQKAYPFTILDGKLDRNIGLRCLSYVNVPIPQPKYETKDIDGADEDSILFKEGYKDIPIQVAYDFLKKENESFQDSTRRITSLLYKLKNKTLKIHEDNKFSYKIKNISLEDIKCYDGVTGELEVTFLCSPYQYLDSGLEEKNILSGITLVNEYMLSKPTFLFEGTGTLKITKDNKDITIQVSGSVVINTQKQRCYSEDKLTRLAIRLGAYSDLWLEENSTSNIKISVVSGTITKAVIIPNIRTR